MKSLENVSSIKMPPQSVGLFACCVLHVVLKGL